jgi:hypothetical protein
MPLRNLISLSIAVVWAATTVVTLPAWGAETGLPLFVGFIEDVEPGNLSPAMASIHARVAFLKQGADWIPIKWELGNEEAVARTVGLPATVHWTVVFDGRALGTITSKAVPVGWYGDVGTQVITTKPTEIPRIAAGISDFSYSDQKVLSRPLILVSAPNFKDPEGWKPTVLSVDEKTLAIKEFRRRFPDLEHCDQPEEQPIHMIPYFDHEILFIKAYRSKNGEVILGERLDDRRSNCGFFDDQNFFDYWFVLDKQHGFRLLGSQMTPMDAADLDNSGKSEWIFHTSRGEDEDGYELFYEDFSKKASFHWTYH